MPPPSGTDPNPVHLGLPEPVGRQLTDLGVDLATVSVLQESGKAVTVAATMAGEPVVIKVLISEEPMWIGHHQAEQEIYRVVAAEGCPLRVPGLRHTGDQVTVVSRLPGAPLDSDRYPRPASAVRRAHRSRRARPAVRVGTPAPGPASGHGRARPPVCRRRTSGCGRSSRDRRPARPRAGRLFGHSYGASLALAYAWAHPDQDPGGN
jgi:hypothetical protein